MTLASLSTQFTTGLIVLVVFLSGPLVPMADFTADAGNQPSFDERSSATISIVKPPSDDFRIAPGRFGTGPYLYSSPVIIYVDQISGAPTISYELVIPGLSYATASLTFPSDTHEGENLTLSLERSTFEPELLTEPAYLARLTVSVRTGEETRIVLEQNLTVTVEGMDDG